MQFAIVCKEARAATAGPDSFVTASITSAETRIMVTSVLAIRLLETDTAKVKTRCSHSSQALRHYPMALTCPGKKTTA